MPSSACGGNARGDVAGVVEEGGQEEGASHVDHGVGLDVEQLGVLLGLGDVAGVDLGLVEDAVLVEEGDVLGLDHGGQGVRRGLEVGQAAALGLLLPLLE